MKKRISYIDIARAFAIIFIVLGHTLVHSEHCSMIFKFLYSFHVVMFFIISGYTFRIKEDMRFIDFFKNKFSRIMIPYFIWALLFLIPYLLFGGDVSSNLSINSTFDIRALILNILYGVGASSALKQNSSLWFLPALFSMEMVYYFVIKSINKNSKAKLPVLLIVVLIGYVSNYFIHSYFPWGINTVLNLGFFFLIGYLINNEKINRFISKWYVTILFMLFGVGACYLNVGVSCIDYVYGNFSLALISGLCLSIVFINISRYINSNIVLEYIGRNTMGILIFHKLVIIVFQTKLGVISQLLSNSNIYIELILSIMILCISIFSSLIITWVIRRVVPFLIGENRKKI